MVDALTLKTRRIAVTRLREYGAIITNEEFQSWNYGFSEIASTKFTGLRKNQAFIVKRLSEIWRSNYFEL